MSITTEEFVTSFHTLQGTTIGEKRKNLFLLLNKVERADVLDISNLNPTTPLEEKFKLETLRYFGKTQDLIETLKSENPILIKHVLKIPKCWEIITNYSIDELLLLLSHISFNVKLKILNKLPLFEKNQERCNHIFKAVSNKYGFYLASRVLPACTPELVLKSLQDNQWLPTPQQLQITVNNHPNLTEEILKVLLAKNNKIQYKIYLANIAKNYPDIYTELFQNDDVLSRPGRRTTHAFVKNNKEKIMKQPSLYYKLLHNKQISKSLGGNFADMYLELFPKKVEKFSTSFTQIMDILKTRSPKVKNCNLIVDTFSKKYGKQIWEYPNLVTPKILELLPVQERIQLLKPEYKGELSEDEWICYSTTDKSIPYLKKRISFTSDIKTRAQLMELLVETCKLNDDKTALAGLCQYMISQHRNDHMTVRLAFLRRIRTRFGLNRLDESHWTAIYELMLLFSLNNETFYHYHEFLEPYIHFRLSIGLSVQDQLTAWLKQHTSILNIVKEVPAYEKQCLFAFGDLIPTLFTDDDLSYFNVLYLQALLNWNKRHPTDEFSLFSYPNAIDHFHRILDGKVRRYVPPVNEIIKYFVQTKLQTDIRNNLLKLILGSACKYLCFNIFKWLISNEPQSIYNNIDIILADVLARYETLKNPTFWILSRNYSHLKLPKRVTEICLNNLKETKEYSVENSITALSYLLPVNELQVIIKTYKPIDLRKVESENLRKIQRCLGKECKNVIPSSLALDCLLLFSKGDHLKLIKSSLYSIVGNLNEPKLLPIFNELGKHSMVCRKHAMHLTLRTLDKKQIFAMFSQIIQIEKNAKFRKFFFRSCFNFFTQNSDGESWKLLKTIISELNVNDKDVIEILLAVEKIPQPYFSVYITLVWNIVSNCHLEEKFEHMEHLISSIKNDKVSLLEKEFSKAIIHQYLFHHDNDNFQAAIHSFTSKFLIYCGNDSDVEEVFINLRSYTSKTWSSYDIKNKGRASIANFVTTFCLEFLNDLSNNVQIFKKFIELWSESFKPHESFNEYLHLEFTSIYLEKLSMADISSRFENICNSLVEKYGLIVVNPLCEKIVSFLSYFVKSNDEFLEENRYIIIEHLLKSTCSTTACCILVILLLDNFPPTLEETLKKYEVIIENMERCNDVTVQFYLHKHLRSVVCK